MPAQPKIALIGAKGGVAATTCTVLTAAATRPPHQTALVVDLTGDLAVQHRIPPDEPGLSDLEPDHDIARRIAGLSIPLGNRLSLLARGSADLADVDAADRHALWTALDEHPTPVVVDAGAGTEALARLDGFDGRRCLVVSSCLAAVSRARTLTAAYDDLVVVHDASRPFTPAAIEAELGRVAAVSLTRTAAVATHNDYGALIDHATGLCRPFEALADAYREQSRPSRTLF